MADDWKNAPVVQGWESAEIVEPTTTKSESAFSGLKNFGDGAVRGAGLTARNILKTPGMVADFAGNIVNAGISGFSKVGELLGDEPITVRVPTNSTEFINEKLTDAGLPTPDTPLERIGTNIQDAAIMTALPIKGGEVMRASKNPVTAGVGNTLASNPTIQGVSAASGSGAAGHVRESGGSEGEQMAAGLVGSLTPGVAVPLSQSMVRGAIRGGEAGRQALQKNIDTFERAGTTPTVSQGTEGRVAQAVESFLAKFPGGAGQMAKSAKGQADDVAARVEKIADDLSPRSTAEKAGRSVEVGISGKGGFVDRFQDSATKLYDDVDAHIDVNAPTPLTNTSKFLAETTAPVKGAEQTSQLLSSKFLDGVAGAVDADLKTALANGVDGLPYSSIKALRSRVGAKINNLSLVDDATKADLKRLYGSLSDDLTAHVKATGDAQAIRSVERANNFYRAGIKRIEAIESVVNKNGGPEKVFNAVLSGTKEGATVLRTVMKSLKPDEQKALTAAVVRRLGKATPGQQDASGEAFSVSTYLTNWARLSPEARSALFSRFGGKFSKDMDALADFASNIRGGSDVFKNPSGTGQAMSLQAVGGGTVALTAFGQFELAAIAAGTTIGANLTSRLMTNPRFVRWLAVQTKMPAGAYAAQVNALARMAKDDRDIALAVGLLKEKQSNPDNQNDGGQDQ